MLELPVPEGSGGWLRLMPAGPAPHREYWTALKQLRERLRFDDSSGKGLAALLDLHARIQDELKPDYLLIDSRTGVTEPGGTCDDGPRRLSRLSSGCQSGVGGGHSRHC